MKLRTKDFLVSLLIPVYNEEENILIFYEHVVEFITIFNRYEIVFIDDGSKDQTLQEIQNIQKLNSNVHYLSLSKNFGHQNALKAGLDFCRGDVVISMDGDLQHPPSLIPEMIGYWKEGYDVVITIRKDSTESRLFKKFTSHYFYKFLTKISCIDLKSGTADFRLLDKKVVEVLRKYNESDIFFRGFIAWVGFRQIELPYISGKRVAGETKYTLRKMLRLASSGLLGFSVFPLRVVSLVGLVISCVSFCYGFYAILMRIISDDTVSGWASVIAGIYFLGGIQLLSIGICGEYVGKIFMQVKNRPQYIVAESSFHLP